MPLRRVYALKLNDTAEQQRQKRSPGEGNLLRYFMHGVNPYNFANRGGAGATHTSRLSLK
jgi:hypothetical protein